ncbi:sensor histidine kinase [Brevibacillus daliensis]|uniref:sensor histidine kinase n=1 Tax=Brevibacillus daliensis TaxID=2892995 RepID=UPI001E608448|nr:HAMP domain-containing sensor histidine kinase [Brevibacillus daliensis]
MFNTVKARLTLLFTGSLLIILVMFIIVLYIFISGDIKNNEIAELNSFYEKEEHEFLEIFFEDKHKYLEYKPEKNIFYYVFDRNHNLVSGEETVKSLAQYIERNDLHKQSSKSMKEIEWENTHFLLVNYSLQHDGRIFGSVMIGMEITNDKHLIDNIIWNLLFLTLLFSILFALAGYFFAGQAMKPIQKSFLTQRKFVADASHELRTPLSIFYSSIDVLAREEKENLSSFGQEVLEDVKNEAEMMNSLLNDLLFLARNDQDNLELELEELNLSLLLYDLLKRFSGIVPFELTLTYDIQNDVVLKGDRVRIQQFMYILLDNAVRYTKEGTVICRLKMLNQKIVIQIQDTGLGISPEDLPNIFDRFYRGDPSRNKDGSGLGLSIAKTIVNAHGGDIQVKSEVGKGTEFSITFASNMPIN